MNRISPRRALSLSLLPLGALSLTSCDLFLLFQQIGANYYIPLGTNEIAYFTYRDLHGTAELDWNGTIRATPVQEKDIPYEDVAYWYTDEEGEVRSRTQSLLKNAMGNHAPAANPIFDSSSCIDLIELRIDQGEGLENVDIYILPNKFGILSWALEGNSETNPLHFDPQAIYGEATIRKGSTFFLNQEGWELTFRLK